MIRLGLCCIFREAPISSAPPRRRPSAFSRDEGRKKLADLCAANAVALMEALQFCSANGIGCFRVNSQILPLKTHPDVGYEIEGTAWWAANRRPVSEVREVRQEAGLRTTFHPDQFVVLNSPKPDVVEQSLQEIEYQAEVAQWIGADVINIHAGGAYGDKEAALERFAKNLARLSKPPASCSRSKTTTRPTRPPICCRSARPKACRSSTMSIITVAIPMA